MSVSYSIGEAARDNCILTELYFVDVLTWKKLFSGLRRGETDAVRLTEMHALI